MIFSAFRPRLNPVFLEDWDESLFLSFLSTDLSPFDFLSSSDEVLSLRFFFFMSLVFVASVFLFSAFFSSSGFESVLGLVWKAKRWKYKRYGVKKLIISVFACIGSDGNYRWLFFCFIFTSVFEYFYQVFAVEVFSRLPSAFLFLVSLPL